MGAETVVDDTMMMDLGMGGSRGVGTRRPGAGRRGSQVAAIRWSEGARWGSAEGLTWVLRGWTAQLRGLGEEVGPAVAQLWTLYLRQLRMGFEEGGHFAAAPCNMLYRER